MAYNDENDLTELKKKKLGSRARLKEIRSTVSGIKSSPSKSRIHGTAAIRGGVSDVNKEGGGGIGASLKLQRTLQGALEQRRQGGIGPAPGAQTPDKSGVGTGISTFQGQPIDAGALEKQYSATPETTTPLKDRLASYSKAIKTYEEMKQAKDERRGVNRVTTIGQTGGYGLLDKSRREQRNEQVRRRSAEGDIRRAMRRGEISPRNAATMLKTISQEALGREALETKEGIAAGELAAGRAGLGLKARTAGAELGVKQGRLDLDTAKALIDKRFKAATLGQEKFGLGIKESAQFTKEQTLFKDLVTSVSEGKMSEEQAAPIAYTINPSLAREIFGYGPEIEEE